MITKWTTIEMDVTPKHLKMWAERLNKKMDKALVGDEVPALEFKSYETKTIIILRADQEAFHKKEKGEWI